MLTLEDARRQAAKVRREVGLDVPDWNRAMRLCAARALTWNMGIPGGDEPLPCEDNYYYRFSSADDWSTEYG